MKMQEWHTNMFIAVTKVKHIQLLKRAFVSLTTLQRHTRMEQESDVLKLSQRI